MNAMQYSDIFFRTEVSVQPAEEDLRNCEDLFATPNDSSSESVALEEETADEKSS